MYKIPFHRKVLPWLFTIIFLIMAPAVVFYTSGYRWNPKKNAIERNGTLIVDTIPTGASIKLNGKKIPETTPVTLQNMAPGSYNIELELKNHHSWSKILWIEPERVTFVSGVYLWSVSQPEYLGYADITNLFSDTDTSASLLVANTPNNTTDIWMMDGETSTPVKKIAVPENIDAFQVAWNPNDSSQALIYGYTSNTPAIWMINQQNLSANKLPWGNYHWQAKELIGYTDDYRLSVRKDQTVSRETKELSIKDELQDHQILELPQSTGLILTRNKEAEEGSILPNGAWSFWNIYDDNIILQDQNQWLWIDTGQDPAQISQVHGDWLYSVTEKRKVKYAFKNNNEAWVWQEKQPELIYRQSDPLTAVAWHPSGRDLMVATKNEIIVFNLDSRDGRYKTILANFDNISSAMILQDTIYVVGQKDGQQGLWKLPLSIQKNSAFLPLSSLGL